MKTKLLQWSVPLAGGMILVTFCSLELVQKGWQPFEWDLLLISGLLLFLVGVRLSMDVPRKMDDTLTRLVNRGVLHLNPEALQQLQNHLQRRTTTWSHRAGLIVAVAILGAFLIAFKLPFPPLKLPLTILEVLGGYIAGRYLGRMASYGTLGLLLKQAGIVVHVKPGYLDGVAGLKPIGDVYFFQALVASFPALFLAVWLVLIPLWPAAGRYDSWQVPYLLLLPLALAFEILAFLVPLWLFHRDMQTQKAALLQEADTLGQRIVRLQAELAEQPDVQQYTLLKEHLSYMTQRYWDIERLPTWPVDIKTRRRFTLNNVILFLPLLTRLIDEKSMWRHVLEVFGGMLQP